MNRQQLVNAIKTHVDSPNETTNADLALVWELVWALTWSIETRATAMCQMQDVVSLNKKEREANNEVRS